MPALNDLLAPYGIAFGDAILEGQVGIDSEKLFYASGSNIVRFPARGWIHSFYLSDKAVSGKHSAVRRSSKPWQGGTLPIVPPAIFDRVYV